MLTQPVVAVAGLGSTVCWWFLCCFLGGCFWGPKFHQCVYLACNDLVQYMMVIPASGVAGVAAVKSFKRKWRLVLEGEKRAAGQRMAAGKQSYGL